MPTPLLSVTVMMPKLLIPPVNRETSLNTAAREPTPPTRMPKFVAVMAPPLEIPLANDGPFSDQMPTFTPVIVPVLVTPPENRDTPSRKMPTLVPAIVPMLVTPPEKVCTVRNAPEGAGAPTSMPLRNPEIVPLLVMPFENVDTPLTLIAVPPPLPIIVPALTTPPAKVATVNRPPVGAPIWMPLRNSEIVPVLVIPFEKVETPLTLTPVPGPTPTIVPELVMPPEKVGTVRTRPFDVSRREPTCTPVMKPEITPLWALVMPPAKVETPDTPTALPVVAPAIVPELTMPPAKLDTVSATTVTLLWVCDTTAPTWMPLRAPAIVPMLVIPPAKVDTPSTRMPVPTPAFVNVIRPELVTLPPNDEIPTTRLVGDPVVWPMRMPYRVTEIRPPLVMPSRIAGPFSEKMPVAAEMAPLLKMPPAKVDTPSRLMPTCAPEMVPPLVTPPEKADTVPIEMPNIVAKIVPLLMTPFEKVETLSSAMPTRAPEIVPMLVMPPMKVETPPSSRPTPLTDIAPRFETPPEKVCTDRLSNGGTVPMLMPICAPEMRPALVPPPVKVDTPLTRMPVA